MRLPKVLLSLTVLSASALLAGSLALATTFFVDDNPTPAGEDGSAARPFRTITSAINNALSGDTVMVAPGIYRENILVISGLHLMGAGADTTIIDGGGFANTITAISFDPNTTIEGFTIRNGRGLSGGGILISGTVIVRNNKISGNIVQGFLALGGGALGGGICVSGSGRSEDNVVEANTAISGQGGGIAVVSGSPVITRNVIRGNAALAASDGFYGYGGGIALLGASVRPVITSNIITGNRA